jgi:adenosylmethionine-8-amino-7-oxononanoate aminotransferase
VYQAVDDLRHLDAAHILHGLYNPSDRDQLTIVTGGDGAVVRDVGGHEYLDGISCLWNLNLGLGRQELVDAAAEQMKKLAYSCTYSGFANIPAIELAARLSNLAYEGLTATFFTASGADANECAFKTARFYWKRQGKRDKIKILSLENGYHGVTLAAMSATGIPAYWSMFQPRIPEFIHVPSPNPYRCNFATPGEDPGTAAARLLEEAIRREGAETVAAFIVEPVQGAGGVMVPPENYYPLVREICNRYDVLLIADEVITGFGRTGRWFALSHWGVEPDIMTFAKGVTSAYLPLGGMMVTQKIAEAINGASPSERWMHASTYSGHPVCCAVALRTLEIMEREKLVERAARLGRYMLRGLEALSELESVGDVRGLGLMAGVELVVNRTTKAPFDRGLKVGDRIRQKAHHAGLIVRNRGDIINIAPPFVISEDQLDTLVSILRGAIVDTTQGLS